MSSKEYNKQHYEKNKAHYKKLNTAWRNNNLEKMRAIRARWKERHPERNLMHIAKMRAKATDIEFNLTVDDIVIPTHCPVFGIKLVKSKGNRAAPDAPSLDRFDNTKGYVKGNVRVISWRANMLKRDGTLEEFEQLVAYLKT